ncbi:MAG: hypothetical protein ACREVD_09520 [Burkholderiales bacterium]
MRTTQYAFAAAARPDRFVCLVANAREAGEVIGAVRAYLEAWPADKVASVQKVDAGWAPFDESRRPTPLYRAADLREICGTVHGQCAALRSAGLALAPELLELDLFLFFACEKLAALEAATCN